MIVNRELYSHDIVIDLCGPEGNAFVLLGYAKNYAKQLGYSQEKINNLLGEMQSSDYENLIEVFDDHFGDFVTLLR